MEMLPVAGSSNMITLQCIAKINGSMYSIVTGLINTAVKRMLVLIRTNRCGVHECELVRFKVCLRYCMLFTCMASPF